MQPLALGRRVDPDGLVPVQGSRRRKSPRSLAAGPSSRPLPGGLRRRQGEHPQRLAEGKRRNHRPDQPPLPLANLGTCGHCGKPLYCKRDTNGQGLAYLVIACSERVNHGKAACPDGARSSSLAAVLAKVLGVLAENLLAEDAVSKLVKQARESNGRPARRYRQPQRPGRPCCRRRG
jgi:hypothetical protein